MAFALVATALGCGGLEPELSDADEQLFGTPLTFDCSNTQILTIQAALAHLQARVSSGAFAQCFRDAQLATIGWPMHETVAGFIDTPDPVLFVCAQLGSASGRARIDIPQEVMELDVDFLDNSPFEIVAGTIAHELYHNHGFRHPHEAALGHDVEHLADECASGQRLSGWRRSDLSDAGALDHIGKVAGGGEREIFCPRDYGVVGLRGRVDGIRIAFGVTCGREDLGNITRYASSQPAAKVGTPYESMCPPDRMLTGVAGYTAGGRVRGLEPLCSRIDDIRGWAPTHDVGPLVGDAAGQRYVRRCEAHEVVTGFRVVNEDTATPSALWRIQPICDDFHETFRRPERRTPVVGVFHPTTRAIRRCEGNQVMTGLYGRVEPTWVDRPQPFGLGSTRELVPRLETLGGTCRPMTETMVAGDAGRAGFTGVTPPLGFSASTEERHFVERCSGTDVLVGAEVRLDQDALVDVLPLCVDYVEWAAGRQSGAPPSGSKLFGPGDDRTLLCDRGEVAIGVDGTEGFGFVVAASLICAAPEPAVPSTSPTPVGGPGGNAFAFRCPGGGPLNGLRASVVGGDLQSVGALCGARAGDRVSNTSRMRSPLFGDVRAELSPISFGCSADHVTIGARISYGTLSSGATFIDGVGLRCQRLSDFKDGTQLGIQYVGMVGDDDVSAEATCPNGEIAVGLSGRSGARVDALGLVCAAPDLAPGDVATVFKLTGQDALVRISLDGDRPDGLRARVTPSTLTFTPVDVWLRRGLPPTPTAFDASGSRRRAGEEVALDGLVQEGDYYLSITGAPGGRFTVQVF